MSRFSVLIAILLTALLAAGSFVALRPSSVTTVPVPLVTGDLGSVSVVRLRERETELTLRRGPLPEQWLLERSPGEEPSGPGAWPVDPTRVRALMRLVMDLRAEGPAADTSSGSRVVATFQDSAGSTLAEITVSGESLGGLATAQTAAGRARIEERFAAMFRAENVLSWRQAVAMVKTPQPATRLVCTSRQNVGAAEEVVDVRRAGSGWALLAPIATDAEAADAAALARAMESVQFIDLVDTKPDEETLGLRTPLRVYKMESVLGVSDVNSVATRASRRMLIQTLEVGGPAPASGTRFARVTAMLTDEGAGEMGRIVWGPQIGILDVATISSLRAGPEQLIARRAIRVPSADIAAISGRVRDDSDVVRFERNGSTWGGADAVRAGRIERLLTLLTQTPAASAVPRGPDSAISTAGTMLNLFERRGNSVASLRVSEGVVTPAANGSPEVRGLVVDDGTVIRRFACEDAGALLALFAQASPRDSKGER